MKIVDSELNVLIELSNGRAFGAAEVRRIVSAIAPISKNINSTNLIYGLSAACHNLSQREMRGCEYALGRKELLLDASEIAWAIAAVADKAEMLGLLNAFVAIIGELERSTCSEAARREG